VLKKHKIPATIFLVTDLIGKEGMVRGVPMEYLNWPQIKEMHQSELIDFEPHSKSHAKLTEKQPEVIKEEIVDSKKIIEKELNKKCPLFAYPFGLRNYEVGKIVEENFRGAVGTNRGFLGEESNIFMLPRQSIDSEVNKERFKLKI
jgi:peptidoglycan/xylan/chitin deacetylase (PgdA/CDA1 family)